MGRYPSGQRGQTVNLLAKPSEVRILPCPQDTYTMHAGVAQLVEHQPSKLRVASSSLVSRSMCRGVLRFLQPVCRLSSEVEHFHGKEGVLGSIPRGGSVTTNL